MILSFQKDELKAGRAFDSRTALLTGGRPGGRAVTAMYLQ
jgi:hypothetical protein